MGVDPWTLGRYDRKTFLSVFHNLSRTTRIWDLARVFIREFVLQFTLLGFYVFGVSR